MGFVVELDGLVLFLGLFLELVDFRDEVPVVWLLISLGRGWLVGGILLLEGEDVVVRVVDAGGALGGRDEGREKEVDFPLHGGRFVGADALDELEGFEGEGKGHEAVDGVLVEEEDDELDHVVFAFFGFHAGLELLLKGIHLVQ